MSAADIAAAGVSNEKVSEKEITQSTTNVGGWKRFKTAVRHTVDSIADSIEGVGLAELKIQLHLDKLKRPTHRYTEPQHRQRRAMEEAYKHVCPLAAHPFYASVKEPIRARLYVESYDELCDFPKIQVAPGLDQYRALVKQIHIYIIEFQRERYQTYDQNDMLRAIDAKLRLNDPTNIILQELKEWLVKVVEEATKVSVRKTSPSSMTYISSLNSGPGGSAKPMQGGKLDMAQALLELKNFSVTSNLTRQVDNYRCYLLELMTCGEFGFSTSVAFGQIASALTAIGLQADLECKEAIEHKCLDEIGQYLAQIIHALFEFIIFVLTNVQIKTSSVLFEHVNDTRVGNMYGFTQYKNTRNGMMLMALMDTPALKAMASDAKCKANIHGSDEEEAEKTNSVVIQPLFMTKMNPSVPPVCWALAGKPAPPTEEELTKNFKNLLNKKHLKRKPADQGKEQLTDKEYSDQLLSAWFNKNENPGVASFFTCATSYDLCALNRGGSAESLNENVSEHELFHVDPAEMRACHVKLHEYLHQLAVFAVVNEDTRRVCAESKLSVYGPILKEAVCDSLEVCKQLMVNVVKTIERLRFLTLHVLGHFNQANPGDPTYKDFIKWRINNDRATEKYRKVKTNINDCLQLVEYTLALIQSRSVEDVKAELELEVDSLLAHAAKFTSDACAHLDLPEVVKEGMPAHAPKNTSTNGTHATTSAANASRMNPNQSESVSSPTSAASAGVPVFGAPPTDLVFESVVPGERIRASTVGPGEVGEESEQEEDEEEMEEQKEGQ